MELLTPALLTLVPVVIGLVSVFKGIGLPTRFAPLLAIVLGVVGAIAISGFTALIVIGGIVIGLTASGVYSGTKTFVQG